MTESLRPSQPIEILLPLPTFSYDRMVEMELNTRRQLLKDYGIFLSAEAKPFYIAVDRRWNILVAYNPDENFLVFASPKQNGQPTADFLMMSTKGYGFVGDGVSSVFPPPPEIYGKIKNLGVPPERPDSFFQLLFQRKVFQLIDPSPGDIIKWINKAIKDFYGQSNISLFEKYLLNLPHLVGTAFCYTPYLRTNEGAIVGTNESGKFAFEMIGDGVVIVEGHNKSLALFQSKENTPFDQETLQLLENLLQQYPNLTLDEVRQLPDFTTHLQESYRRKLNQVGGVRAINGISPFFHPLSVSIGIDQVAQVLISTDGVFLGCDPLSIYQGIFSGINFNNDGSAIVSEILRRLIEIKQEQINRYSAQNQTRRVIQEKPTDDWCGLLIRFPTLPICDTHLYLDEILKKSSTNVYGWV